MPGRFEAALLRLCERGGVTGVSWLEELTAALAELLGARQVVVAALGGARPGTARVVAAAGEPRPADVALDGSGPWSVTVPLRSAAGAPLGLLAAAGDLPDDLDAAALLASQAPRAAAELERLPASPDELVARIARAVPGLIYLVEVTTGRVVYTSRDTTALLGGDARDEAMLAALQVHFDPADRAHASGERRRLGGAPDGEVIDYELRWHDDERVRWLRNWETVFERGPDGAARLLLGVCQDVSETKQRALDARLRGVLERLPLAVSTSDASGRREHVNAAYLRLLGVTIEEAPTVAAAIGRLVPDAAERTRLTSAIGEYRARPAPREGVSIPHVAVRSADGHERLIDVHMFEDLEFSVTAFVDVTERERYAAELAHTSERLAHANRELESFSYSVSHDLRAPLRHISGFAHALERELGPELGPRAAHHLERIKGSTQRLSRLIDALLALARVAQVPLRDEEADLSAMAGEIVRDLAAATTAGRAIEWSIAPGLRARGDGRLLRTALANLLDNAVKYTARREVARIAVAAAERQGKMWIEVRDNGVGFDMLYVAKLFTPFQRLHTEAEFPGTGIGLATVARIVGRHGGEVEAESRPDGETVVRFTLPGLGR